MQRMSAANKSNFSPIQQMPICRSSVAKLCPILCNPMDHSMPGPPVHCLPEFA